MFVRGLGEGNPCWVGEDEAAMVESPMRMMRGVAARMRRGGQREEGDEAGEHGKGCRGVDGDDVEDSEVGRTLRSDEISDSHTGEFGGDGHIGAIILNQAPWERNCLDLRIVPED